MSNLSPNFRDIKAAKRYGWAFPYVNFAGKGFRYNLGARPRTLWDFCAKLHDISYFDNGIRFSLSPDPDGPDRSKLAKADYIFRIMVDQVDNNLPEYIYERLAKRFFVGADTTRFINNDGYNNVLNDPRLEVEFDYYMIPWSLIPLNEQLYLEEVAKKKAKTRVEEKLAGENPINFRYSRKKGMLVRRNAPSKPVNPKLYKRRLINALTKELKYNQRAEIDDTPWRNWASGTYGDAWAEAVDIR